MPHQQSHTLTHDANSFDNFTMESVIILAIVEFLNEATNLKFQKTSRKQELL